MPTDELLQNADARAYGRLPTSGWRHGPTGASGQAPMGQPTFGWALTKCWR